jgi:hypothetical protein
MEIELSSTIFIYVDESGNFDFSTSGTRHFVMAAYTTTSPLESVKRLGKLKYELLSKGVNVPNFHASEDSQRVRNAVYREISLIKDVSAYVFWIEKDPTMNKGIGAARMYEMFGLAIAQAAMVEVSKRSLENVVIVFDKALKHKEEQAFLSRAKSIFAKAHNPFHVYFHNVSKDFNGQIADYIAWAHYVSLERNELRPLIALPPALASHAINLVSLDVFKR